MALQYGLSSGTAVAEICRLKGLGTCSFLQGPPRAGEEPRLALRRRTRPVTVSALSWSRCRGPDEPPAEPQNHGK